MSTRTTEDGGYYAIKGFAYQIDKAILEILESANENVFVNIEQIQDINSKDSVIQVKYKETAKLVPSQVSVPICKLIEDFIKDGSCNYILYAYFKDLNGYDRKVNKDKQVSKATLDLLLGERKKDFTNQKRKEFCRKFYLDLSPDFQVQFNIVISKLRESGFGASNDEAIFYYANISDYLYKKVYENPTKSKHKRRCNRKEIFDYLSNGKKLVFTSSLREYQGEKKYFSFIKKRYFSPRNIDDFERFIFIELHEDEAISNIKECVIALKNKFYKKVNTSGIKKIKSQAPYIYLGNISDEKLVTLKTELVDEGFLLRDGHEFMNATFSMNAIKKSVTIADGVSMKFINTIENFQKLTLENLGKTKIIYQFYLEKKIPISVDVKNIGIQIKGISDINHII